MKPMDNYSRFEHSLCCSHLRPLFWCRMQRSFCLSVNTYQRDGMFFNVSPMKRISVRLICPQRMASSWLELLKCDGAKIQVRKDRIYSWISLKPWSNENWWELASESLHKNFLNFHGLLNQTRTGIAQDITDQMRKNSRPLWLRRFEPVQIDESWLEYTRVYWSWWSKRGFQLSF